MDLCDKAYYKDNDNVVPRLYCNIDNGTCIYSKKCLKVNKFIPLDGEKWKECYKFIMDKKNNIPQGSNLVQFVRPRKNGGLYVYVLVGDNIEKIPTGISEINQDYVYLKDEIDGYTISLTPFEKKATRKRVNKNG